MMSTHARSVAAFRFGIAVLRYAIAMIAFWHGRAWQRRQLGQATAEQLEDMGLGTEDAQRESRKPFWRN